MDITMRFVATVKPITVPHAELAAPRVARSFGSFCLIPYGACACGASPVMIPLPQAGISFGFNAQLQLPSSSYRWPAIL